MERDLSCYVLGSCAAQLWALCVCLLNQNQQRQNCEKDLKLLAKRKQLI